MRTGVNRVTTGIVAQQDRNQNKSQLLKYKNYFEDLIITTKASNKDLELALTKCYVPWCDKSRKALTAKLKCPPVPDDEEDLGPTFFMTGGYKDGDNYGWCCAFYWRDIIIMCVEVKAVGKRVKFVDASLYIWSSESDQWINSENEIDITLPIGNKASTAILSACAHWDELCGFECDEHSNEMLRLKSGTLKSNDFKKIECHMYGREWSGMDYRDPLSHVSSVWQYPFNF